MEYDYGYPRCNAIEVHSDTTLQHSYTVHDNYIYHTRCEAIALDTMDPSQGAVTVYNNIIENSEPGRHPEARQKVTDTPRSWLVAVRAFRFRCTTTPSTNAGAFGGASAGAVRAFGATNFTNNIFDLLSGQQYVSLDTNFCHGLPASNNLFSGAGNPLACSPTVLLAIRCL